MLNRILFVALISGLVSGLALTVIQLGSSIPIIEFAETFEGATGDVASVDQPIHSHGDPSHAHDHGATSAPGHEPWAPEDGIERSLWTGVTNILLGFGAALLIAAGLVLHGLFLGKQVNSLIGLAWGRGSAAFLSFSLAPALGLPPELPGTTAAALEARQVWWIGTALATATGLAMIAYCRWIWLVAAIALLALPHVIGAPHPAVHESLVPAQVEEKFIIMAVGTSMIFWLLLGSLTGSLVQRMNLIGPAPVSRTSTAAAGNDRT